MREYSSGRGSRRRDRTDGRRYRQVYLDRSEEEKERILSRLIWVDADNMDTDRYAPGSAVSLQVNPAFVNSRPNGFDPDTDTDAYDDDVNSDDNENRQEDGDEQPRSAEQKAEPENDDDRTDRGSRGRAVDDAATAAKAAAAAATAAASAAAAAAAAAKTAAGTGNTLRCHVIPVVSSPHTEDLQTTAATMAKFTRRLAFRLDEMAAEVPPGHERRAAVDGLANKIWWFLRDLDACTATGGSGNGGGCPFEQLPALLEQYNEHRIAYYELRDQMYGLLTTGDSTAAQPQPQCQSPPPPPPPQPPQPPTTEHDDYKPKGFEADTQYDADDENSSDSSKKVYKCPGVLDVTTAVQRRCSCRRRPPKGVTTRTCPSAAAAAMTRCRAAVTVQTPPTCADLLVKWLSAIKEFVCSCLPCGDSPSFLTVSTYECRPNICDKAKR